MPSSFLTALGAHVLVEASPCIKPATSSTSNRVTYACMCVCVCVCALASDSRKHMPRTYTRPHRRSRSKHPSLNRPRTPWKSRRPPRRGAAAKGVGHGEGARPRPPRIFAGHKRGGGTVLLRENCPAGLLGSRRNAAERGLF